MSDNSTKYIGTAKELKAFLNEWEKAIIENGLGQKKFVWKFNSPVALQFGGICERLAQSLQSPDCISGQPKHHQQGNQYNKVSCRANTQCDTADSSK